MQRPVTNQQTQAWKLLTAVIDKIENTLTNGINIDGPRIHRWT